MRGRKPRWIAWRDSEKGAGDDGLARNDGGDGGEYDRRQAQEFGEHQEERVRKPFRMLQDIGALAEIVERQRRKDQPEPGEPNRRAAEMAEIGIKRFGAGDGEKHRAEDDEPTRPLLVKNQTP